MKKVMMVIVITVAMMIATTKAEAYGVRSIEVIKLDTLAEAHDWIVEAFNDGMTTESSYDDYGELLYYRVYGEEEGEILGIVLNQGVIKTINDLEDKAYEISRQYHRFMLGGYYWW